MRPSFRTVVVLLAVSSLASGASAQTCGWEWANPIPPRTDITRLKHEVGIFVGVGRAGTIIRSTDGYRWTTFDSGVGGDLHGVDWGAGVWVVVGDGVILTSSNGTEWTTTHRGAGAFLLDVEFSVSRFVAVGDGLDGHILTSPLGTVWEQVQVPWIGRADSIAGTNEGFYVAVGPEIWFSSNGFDWEYESAVPAAAQLRSAGPVKKTGSSLFGLDRIDLGWTGNLLFWAGADELWSFSPPERDWQLAATLDGCPPWSDWLGLASGPGWIAASGISGCPSPFLDPTVTILISVDGGETFRPPWQTELGGFPALARYGSRWVAAGAYGDVVTSSDGWDWQCNEAGCASLACEDGFADLAEDEDRLVAVGGVGLCDDQLKRRGGATVARSVDGESWQIEALSGDRFRGVTAIEAGFLGVGDGWLARSTDGEVWTTEASPDGARLRSTASGDGAVVVVGRHGALYVGDGGSSWMKPFLYLSEDLDRVVWDEGLFLALGRNGTVLRSTDSLNWLTSLTTTSVDLKGAAAGSDGWIMVGSDGAILASSDGEVWLQRRSGVNSQLEDVVWSDDRFVAVGWDDGGDGSRPAVVLASTGGVHWTRFPAPGEALKRVRWADDGWIAAGGDRTLLRADCLGLILTPALEHLHATVDTTTELFVDLSAHVAGDATLTLRSSQPGTVRVPPTVVIPAGANSVSVPVTGVRVVSGAVLTMTMPPRLGGGSTTVLVSVHPPEGTPRTPSGRVTP